MLYLIHISNIVTEEKRTLLLFILVLQIVINLFKFPLIDHVETRLYRPIHLL